MVEGKGDNITQQEIPMRNSCFQDFEPGFFSLLLFFLSSVIHFLVSRKATLLNEIPFIMASQ